MHPKFEHANAIFGDVLRIADELRHKLGPGLLEKVYAFYLGAELKAQGYDVRDEVEIVLRHRGAEKAMHLYVDLLVDDCLILELKSVDGVIRSEYVAQTLSYMKLMDCPLGLIYNFGATKKTIVRTKRLILRGADGVDLPAAF